MCWILLKPTSIISQWLSEWVSIHSCMYIYIHWESSCEVRIIVAVLFWLFIIIIHCCWLKCNKFSATQHTEFFPLFCFCNSEMCRRKNTKLTRAYLIFSLLNLNSELFFYSTENSLPCAWCSAFDDYSTICGIFLLFFWPPATWYTHAYKTFSRVRQSHMDQKQDKAK